MPDGESAKPRMFGWILNPSGNTYFEDYMNRFIKGLCIFLLGKHVLHIVNFNLELWYAS